LEVSGSDDRAKAFVNNYLADFQKKFDGQALGNELVGIYDRHFSDEEIKGLLEFYGSPLGQKVAAELPKINREVQLATRSASTQAARQAWQDLRAQFPNAGEGPRQRRLNATAAPARPAGAPILADASQP
jgi:hypothetical protein